MEAEANDTVGDCGSRVNFCDLLTFVSNGYPIGSIHVVCHKIKPSVFTHSELEFPQYADGLETSFCERSLNWIE